jgi:gas vesicle protein
MITLYQTNEYYMTTKTNGKKKGLSTGAVIGIGAGVLATAAATYFFFGPEGKKNRNKLKGWMIRMKGEIVDKMEKAKDMSEEAYHKIVDAAAASYSKEGISTDAVKEFATTLKKQWKGFAQKKKATVKKTAKKVVQKAKKVAKKA